MHTLKYILTVRYWVRKWRFYLVIIIIGLIVSYVGFWFSFASVSAPSFFNNSNFRGFGLITNDTESLSDSMMIVLRISNPSSLYFNYVFESRMNDTYSFVFWFPFRINGIKSNPQNMSISPTDSGSVVSLSYNTPITYWTNGGVPTQKIEGWFNIDNTFTSGSKGVYTITLPFGMGVDSEVFDRTARQLNVTYFSSSNVILHIDLPYNYGVADIFPQLSTGLQSWTPSTSSNPINTLEWNFKTLSETVIVRYEDNLAIGFHENALFAGGIILGVGSSIFLTAFYDWAKDWRTKNKKEEY